MHTLRFPGTRRLQRPSNALLFPIFVMTFCLAAFSATNLRAETAAATEHFVLSDGVKIHYQNIGVGDDAVVFVHCWTCDHTFWRLQVPAVSEKWRTILVDLPGHGRSDKPEREYSQSYFVEGLHAIIVDAGVKRAILVGHSMGASVSRLYAITHPENVKAFINVDGAIFQTPEDGEALKKWQTEFDEFAGSFKGDGADKRTREFIISLFGPLLSEDHRREIMEKTLATPRHVAVSAMEGMGDPALWREKVIPVPTLTVYAKNDELTEAFRAGLRRQFPDLEYLEWEGLGHFFMFEVPDRLNRTLLDFLDKLRDTSGSK